MSTADDLFTVSRKLLDRSKRLNETDFSESLDKLDNSAEAVGKSWSGSWLGYHSRVYYNNFAVPPAGAHFSQEWGLEEKFAVQGTVGDWREYIYDDVIEAIQQRAGNPDIKPQEKEAQETREYLEEAQSVILSVLSNVTLDQPNDKFLEDLRKKVEKKKIFYVNDFIEALRPRGHFMSRDMAAIEKGVHTPPHLAVLANINAIRQPFKACEKLGKVALRAASHLTYQRRRSDKENRIGTNIFIGHGHEKDVMTDDELELKILEKYIAKHKEAEIAGPQMQNKCARELDMREVLREFGIYKEAELEYHAHMWLAQLTSAVPGVSNKPLRRCSKSELNTSKHRYNARAYINLHQKIPRPAWERIRELQGKVSKQAIKSHSRELEQKFKILYSASQAQKDFNGWLPDATKNQYPIAILFIDIDHFKNLNMEFTEAKVDETILPEVQHLLKKLTSQRGEAYRHGGEEFLVILPNHNKDEAMLFAEKLRVTFQTHNFKIDGAKKQLTISVGVALCPNNGKEYNEVLKAANNAEHKAKHSGRNTVILAQ